MKFVDIKNDVAFRKIFGNQKKTAALITLLNTVLRLEGSSRIVRVTILNPYLLPRLVGEKASIIDVRATDQKGRRFVVEMQVADKKGFESRVQYYTARDYSMQIQKGEDYPKLKPTYFVGILNFGVGLGKQYLAKHFTIEEETGACILSDIQYRFIQLPKFKKRKHELVDMVDKWTYFLKHAQQLEMIPSDIEDEGLILAYQEADKHNWDKEELIAYDNMSIKVQDERGQLALAEEKGIEEGENRKEIAAVIGMNQNAIPIPIIAKSLSITVERVVAILNNSDNDDLDEA